MEEKVKPIDLSHLIKIGNIDGKKVYYIDKDLNNKELPLDTFDGYKVTSPREGTDKFLELSTGGIITSICRSFDPDMEEPNKGVVCISVPDNYFVVKALEEEYPLHIRIDMDRSPTHVVRVNGASGTTLFEGEYEIKQHLELQKKPTHPQLGTILEIVHLLDKTHYEGNFGLLLAGVINLIDNLNPNYVEEVERCGDIVELVFKLDGLFETFLKGYEKPNVGLSSSSIFG